jgi:1-acyl-sn-glycerol-3-phosphate acyltransferase
MATRGPGRAHRTDRWRRREPLYPLFLPIIDLLVRALFRVEVHGAANLPRHGPVLLAANHVSYLDPCVLASVAHRAGRRIRFLALSDLFSKPGLGWLLRAGRMIPVHRGLGAEQMLRDARAALGAGEAVLVYPEGTIPAPGLTVEAQRGAGLLALATSAPVVAVGSWGLERRSSRMPPVRRRAIVVFGEPLDLSSLRARSDRTSGREAATALLEAVRDRVLEAKRRA